MKLTHSIAVYAIDGRLNRNFLVRTKSALASIARLSDELHKAFPLHLDRATSGVSRISAYLNLLYHQCIVTATRPLLFCFLKIRLESPGHCLEALSTSQNVRNLIQMCLDSAQQMIYILHCLQSEDLLGKSDILLPERPLLILPRVLSALRPRIRLRVNGRPPNGPSNRPPMGLPSMA